MNSEFSNQTYGYQTNDYSANYYNPCYYEQVRQSVTPPQSINSTAYSLSPDQSFSSLNSSTYHSQYSSPYCNYENYYNTNSVNWKDYPYYCYNYNYYNQSYCNYNDYTYSFSNQQNVTEPQEQYVSLKQEETKCEQLSSKVMKKIAYEEIEDDESDKKRTRIRTQFTMDQRKYLLNIFSKTIYPSKEQLELASQQLGVSISILQTWFKNTRSKQKKLTHTKNL